MLTSATAALIVLGAVARFQAPTAPITPASVNQAGGNFSWTQAPAVAEPVRLMLTPAMSGVIENDEWDPFTSGPAGKTYLEWVPGTIYAAASAPAGMDLLLSLDLGGDGWLVGADNYEARVHVDASNNPTVTVRRLNATNVAGPTWEDLPGWSLSSVCKATLTGSTVAYELQLSDAGTGVLPRRSGPLGVRIDLVPSSDLPLGTTQARSLSPVTFATSRSEGLPSSLHYEVERAERPAIPGDSDSIRFNFSTTVKPPATPPTVKKLTIFAEGASRQKMSDMTAPFPAFDRSGRASIDYVSKVAADATPGYHILEASLLLGDDTPATVETSFRVADPLDVEIERPFITVSPSDRTVTVGFDVYSNLGQPARGSLSFTLDPSLHIVNQSGRPTQFVLEAKGRRSSKFELFIPANTTGTYPIVFSITAGTVTRRVTRYITFGVESPTKRKHKGLFGIG